MYGNLTRQIEHGDSMAPDRDIVRFYAAPNTTAYIVDRLARDFRVDPVTGVAIAETQYHYDGGSLQASPSKGNLTKVVKILNQPGQPNPTATLVYDGTFGNVVAVTDPRGFTTDIRYDIQFHAFPFEVENALHHVQTTLYSGGCPVAYPAGAGLPHSLIDANGAETHVCYDVFGRRKSIIAPGGLAASSIDYVDTPGTVSITVSRLVEVGNQRASTTYFDGLARDFRTVTEGPQGQVIESRRGYDAMGRLRLVSAPYFSSGAPAVSRIDYDPAGRVVAVRDSAGRAVTATYFRGTISVIDPNQNRSDFVLDVFGDVQQSIEHPGGSAGSVVTGYDYDHGGRLIRIHPAAPGVGESAVADTVISYDWLGRRTSLQDPDAGPTSFTYDVNGNVETATDARGVTITTTYDELNRPKTSAASGADPQLITFFYDQGGAALNALGRFTAATGPVAGMVHGVGYDVLGRVIAEEHDLDGRRFSFTTSYDGLGQIRLRTHPETGTGSPGARIRYAYDSNGYLLDVADLAGPLKLVNSIRFDARGRVVDLVTGDGVRSSERYDRLTGLLNEIDIRHGSTDLEKLSFGFDPGGRVTRITDRRNAGWSRQFSYDALNRLLSATGPFGSDLSHATLFFQYDRYGNLTSKDSVARQYGQNGAPPHAVSSVAAQALAYDAAGNLTAFGDRGYTWNTRGQLASILQTSQTAAQYAYDFAGRRLKEVEGGTTRYFVTDDFEWDGTQATVHVFAAGRRIASRSFEYQPSLVTAAITAPDSTLEFALIAAGSGPPILLLVFFAMGLRRRRPAWPRPREAIAVFTVSLFWASFPAPVLAQVLQETDTDRDGISDLEEAYYGTDATNADTDGDGVADGSEIAAGSSPTSALSLPERSPQAIVVGGQVAAPTGPSGFATFGDSADIQQNGMDVHGGRLGYERARALYTRDTDGDGVSDPRDDDDDGDGVPDAIEAAQGSDPLNPASKPTDHDGDGEPNTTDPDLDGDGIANSDDPDSDNDGLSDMLETTVYFTNPLEADSDGDGILDGAELLLGTDPLVPDASALGVFADGDLAPLGNRDGELNAADALLALRMVVDPGLAGPQDLVHGDVAPLGGPPDGAITGGDAVLILRATNGQDVDGDGLATAAETSAGSSPFLVDTDRDGLGDAEEINPPPGTPSTDPANPDTDGDGLLDSEELAPPPGKPITNPLLADSDGDGINDALDAQRRDKIVFYHGDQLGSTTVLTNIRGEVLRRVLYKPYGEALLAPEPSPNAVPEFGFTGQRFEAGLGIYDYGARFYDPALGRFLQPDTLVQDPFNPQSLNRFSYVLNSPVNLVDPTGNQSGYYGETGQPYPRPPRGSIDPGYGPYSSSGFGSPSNGDQVLMGAVARSNQRHNGNSAGGRAGAAADFQRFWFGILESVGGNPGKGSQSVTGTFGVPVVLGAGTVRTELFIAAESALGLAGDARGFDPAPNPTNSRAFFTLDFESGAGAFQINPTCAAGGRCSSALPIGAGNAFNTSISGNSVTVTGSLTNSRITIGPSIDFGIRFNASSSGVTFSGYRNAFPSYEITRGSTFLYRGAETHPIRLFDATGFVRFSGP